MRPRFSALVTVYTLIAVQANAQPAPTSLKPEQRIAVQGDFAGKNGKAAKDMSGVGCMPAAANARRLCLLINDEGTEAQFATVGADSVKPGTKVPLIGSKADPATLGKAPAIQCPKTGKFAEFDGEGVAFQAPFFYIAGSHGCSRNAGEFRLSSWHLARVRVDGSGRPTGKAELTYRLADALLQAPAVAQFVGKDLMSANGLNIEGIAVIDDRLVAGLRAPVDLGSDTVGTFLIVTSTAALFAGGHAPLTLAPEVIPVSLGPKRGIRDLAALADKRLLILAGPAQEQDVPYGLFIADLRANGTRKHLGDLDPLLDDDGKPAKAEAIAILDESTSMLTVAVFFDGLKNGAPRLYKVPR